MSSFALRSIALGLLSLSIAGFSGGAMAAQQSGTVKSTHGAWSILCDTPAGAKSELQERRYVKR